MPRFGVLLILSLFLAGCSSTGVVHPSFSSTATKDYRRVAYEKPLANREAYRRTAETFVAAAKKQDIRKMLTLTSPLTLSVTGRENIRRIYLTNTIPAFQKTGPVTYHYCDELADDTGNHGLLVCGSAPFLEPHGQHFHFAITVMKENGNYYLATFNRLKNQPASLQDINVF